MKKEEFMDYQEQIENSWVGEGLHIDRGAVVAALADDSVSFIIVDTANAQIIAMLPNAMLIADGQAKRVVYGLREDMIAEVSGVTPSLATPAPRAHVHVHAPARDTSGLKRNTHVDASSGWSSYFKNPLKAR